MDNSYGMEGMTAEKDLLEYTAVATISHTELAFAWYTIFAKDDDSAIKMMRDILSGSNIIKSADSIEDADLWINAEGDFRLVRGTEMPIDDGDPLLLVIRESFKNNS